MSKPPINTIALPRTAIRSKEALMAHLRGHNVNRNPNIFLARFAPNANRMANLSDSITDRLPLGSRRSTSRFLPAFLEDLPLQ